MAENVLLDEGRNALVSAQGGGNAVKIASLKIGDTTNVNIDTSDTDINGNLVYSSTSSIISVSVAGNDTVRFLITLDEGVGDFDIGNIVLFTDNNEAFMKMVLDQQVTKIANNLPATVGNRLAFNASLVYNNATSLVDVQVLTQTYASPPDIQNITNLPAAGAAAYGTYLVQNHEHLGVPTLALKRNSDNTWFGLPIVEYLESADFGIFDGGVDGDEHLVNTRRVYVGGFLHKGQPQRLIDGGNLNLSGSFDRDLDFGSL